MKISAVIPTRGDVDISPIMEQLRRFLEITEIIVKIGDTTFNRYRGVRQATNDIIYTQDDDCVTDIRPIIEARRPGVIVNAMTPSHAAAYLGEETLIGFGALFDRSMVEVLDGWEHDKLFLREADRVFATLNPHYSVFPETRSLNCAFRDNRLYRQPEHKMCHRAMLKRIAEFKKTNTQ